MISTLGPVWLLRVARRESPKVLWWSIDLEVGALCFSPSATHLVAACQSDVMLVWDLRLIHERLREMGLDWDEAPLPASPGSQKLLRVEMPR